MPSHGHTPFLPGAVLRTRLGRLLPSKGPAEMASFVRLSVALALAALLVPVLVTPIPPLLDYPNHLSRIWLLGGGAEMAPVSGMYRVTWDTLTNIGIDLLAVLLTRLFDYETVGRIFVAAAALLVPLGGALLWKTVHNRIHFWQLSFVLFAWGGGLLAGFLNFQIGLGLAMLAAATDPMVARRGIVSLAAIRIICAALLILVHAFAFVFYAALLCAISLGPEFGAFTQRKAASRIARSLIAAAATLAVPAILILVLGPSLPGGRSGNTLLTVWSDFQAGFAQLRAAPAGKLRGFFTSIRTYANWLDGLGLAMLVLPVVGSLALRRLAVHAGMLLVSLGLLACYVTFPAFLAATDVVDVRFAFMTPLVLLVGLRPDLPSRVAHAAAVSLLVVSSVRTGVMAWVWHERQADVAALSRVLALVPQGAAILPLGHDAPGAKGGPIGRYSATHSPSYRHLPTLALPWRQAFVPTLFAFRGKQPITILPPWDAISEPNGGFLPHERALVDPALAAIPLRGAPYLEVWRERFDFVLVVNADMPDEDGPVVLPPELDLLSDQGFAKLYRIHR